MVAEGSGEFRNLVLSGRLLGREGWFCLELGRCGRQAGRQELILALIIEFNHFFFPLIPHILAL